MDIMYSLEEYDFCDATNIVRLKENAIEYDNATYHRTIRDNGFQWKCDQDTTDFTIGFEIEKEDVDAREMYKHRTLFRETQWVKESDSSLDDGSGYELVSPVFNLMDNSLEKDIEKLIDFVAQKSVEILSVFEIDPANLKQPLLI